MNVGKFDPKFQEYLRRCENQPASARQRGLTTRPRGAVLASGHCPPLSLLMHGHHGGLHSRTDTKHWLDERRGDAAVQRAIADARHAVPGPRTRANPSPRPLAIGDELAMELYLRLLFSALVDADLAGHRAPLSTPAGPLSVNRRMSPCAHCGGDSSATSAPCPDRRAPSSTTRGTRIYDSAVEAAERDTGVFRLTVPHGRRQDPLRHGVRAAPRDEARSAARESWRHPTPASRSRPPKSTAAYSARTRRGETSCWNTTARPWHGRTRTRRATSAPRRNRARLAAEKLGRAHRRHHHRPGCSRASSPTPRAVSGRRTGLPEA